MVEAVVGMLQAAEGAVFDPFDAAEARLALRALEPIVPFQPADAVSALPSLVAVREAGGIARTLVALRGDEWALTRWLVRPAAERFSGLLNEPDSMAVAHGLGALRTLVDALERCPDVRIGTFLVPLQYFVIAPVHAYRDAILDAGLLPRLATFLEPGPAHPDFFLSSCSSSSATARPPTARPSARAPRSPPSSAGARAAVWPRAPMLLT
jgi:hypothetical protein